MPCCSNAIGFALCAMQMGLKTNAVMDVSIIVPVLNEEAQVVSTLRSLESLPVQEVIVVDGGSTDRTQALVRGTQATLTLSLPGRARQMNHGARRAAGEVVLFLHADTCLPPSAIADIRAALADPSCVGGRFDVRLEGRRWIFKVIGFLISIRSRITRMATGDQAIFVRRAVFKEMGGFPDVPLMEDIAFFRMLKKKGRIACLRSQVLTSSRRWEQDGIWRTIWRMWWLRVLFLSGIPPGYLKRFYGNPR